MKRRIMWNFFAVALVATLMTALMITGALYTMYKAQVMQELNASSGLVAEAMEHDADWLGYLQDISGTGTRYTWIDANGQVLFDNQADISRMENHLGRKEVADALRRGFGESVRFSPTQGEVQLYYARRMSDGSVIRLAHAQTLIWALIVRIGFGFVAIGLFVSLLTSLLARRLTSRIVRPINEIDLEHPESADIYDEMAPLVARIKSQKEQIFAQLQEMGRQQQEFKEITENMEEGLLILSGKGIVLSANKSAQQLFGSGIAQGMDRNILTLNRSVELQSIMERAFAGNKVSDIVRLGGRVHQLLISPVIWEGGLSGMVMILLDITDRFEAEKARQEFTANVSHELKTPLTSISGYAELIQNGLAKPMDVPDFAGKIAAEANRLMMLVEDIMRLSQLDEGLQNVNRERLGLKSIADGVCERLADRARQREVALTVDGEEAMIDGIKSLVDEMVFNLVDNAIKYNRPGGYAAVHVQANEDGAVLTVVDNGIGIPNECLGKVFERFYRVDKSHSRQTGGTGLGLSIVKHGAQVHGATVSLHSEVGRGTEVAIRFPIGRQ